MSDKKIIDVSGKSKITIMKEEKPTYIENHATLDVTRELSVPCGYIDPLGQDTVIDCLKCHNSDYQIIYKGNIIKSFNGVNEKQNQENTTRYIIEFFEPLPKTEELLEYLEDDTSDYRITREEDGVVLRPSIEDIRKRKEQEEKRRQEFEEWQKRLFGMPSQEEEKKQPYKSSTTKKKTIFSRILETKHKKTN